jgi:ankyrin repeat protein
MNKLEKTHFKTIKTIIDNNDVETLKTYLDINKIDINSNFSINENQSDSIFFYAVKKSKTDIVRALISIDGIKVDTPNTNFVTPILHAIAMKKEEIFDIIMQHPQPGLKYAGTSSESMYPLTRASQARNIRMVKAIAEHPDNSFELCQNQPLFYALSNKQTEIGLYLVKHPEFNPYAFGAGRNAFEYACETYNFKVLKAVLDLPQFDPSIPWKARFKMDEQDKDVFKPLWWHPFEFKSSMQWDTKLADIVFNHPKIDVNQKDEDGKRLIDKSWRVDIQHITFELLLQNKKVDIYSLNPNGKTVLEELLLSYRNGDTLDNIFERRVNLIVDRLISEKPEIINDQCERLVNLKVFNKHKDYALGTFRHVLLQKSFEKESRKEIKRSTNKI